MSQPLLPTEIAAAPSSGRRGSYSLKEKQIAIEKCQLSEGRDYVSVAEVLRIPPETVRSWWRNRNVLKEKMTHSWFKSSQKHLKKPQYMVISECLYLWFLSVWGTPGAMDLSRPYLLAKARTFAALHTQLQPEIPTPKLTEHFIRIWEKHVGIKLKRKHGEGGGVSGEMVEDWRNSLPKLLSRYHPEDVWNADEFGLFYKLHSTTTTYSTDSDQPSGHKLPKDRWTVLVCVSCAGETLPPFVIGKSQYKKYSHLFQTLKIEYRGNSTAWMIRDLFIQWVTSFNILAVTREKNYLLLLDNCSVHRIDGGQFSNVKIAMLPPNTTSHTQPCDQGVIKVIKQFYKRKIIQEFLEANEVKLTFNWTPKEAFDLLKKSFSSLTKETVIHCMEHAGISPRLCLGDSDSLLEDSLTEEIRLSPSHVRMEEDELSEDGDESMSDTTSLLDENECTSEKEIEEDKTIVIEDDEDQRMYERLHGLDTSLPPTFEEFVQLERDESLFGPQSDEDILKEVVKLEGVPLTFQLKEDAGRDDEEVEEEIPPEEERKQLIQAINKLKMFYLKHPEKRMGSPSLLKIKHDIVQATGGEKSPRTIDTFFRKKKVPESPPRSRPKHPHKSRSRRKRKLGKKVMTISQSSDESKSSMSSSSRTSSTTPSEPSSSGTLRKLLKTVSKKFTFCSLLIFILFLSFVFVTSNM
jgi:hypothetical protein